MTADSLLEFWSSNGNKLASYKMPSQVFVWPEEHLPRGATGKIPKKEIRAKLMVAHEKHPHAKL